MPAQVGTLAGPFVAAALLLMLGGVFKAVRPQPTARALTGAGLGLLAPLARPLGVAEVAVGLAALVTSSRLAAGLMAAFYASFAGFVAIRLARPAEAGGGSGGCGCFGESEGPPTPVHAVLNLAAAGVAGAVAAGSGGGLPAALRDQPLAGIPMITLALLVTGLAYAVLTVLPRTLGQIQAVQQ